MAPNQPKNCKHQIAPAQLGSGSFLDPKSGLKPKPKPGPPASIVRAPWPSRGLPRPRRHASAQNLLEEVRAGGRYRRGGWDPQRGCWTPARPRLCLADCTDPKCGIEPAMLGFLVLSQDPSHRLSAAPHRQPGCIAPIQRYQVTLRPGPIDIRAPQPPLRPPSSHHQPHKTRFLCGSPWWIGQRTR